MVLADRSVFNRNFYQAIRTISFLIGRQRKLGTRNVNNFKYLSGSIALNKLFPFAYLKKNISRQVNNKFALIEMFRII